MRYLVMKETKEDRYKIVRKFTNLREAIFFAVKNDLFGTGLVVKQIENFEVREK